MDVVSAPGLSHQKLNWFVVPNALFPTWPIGLCPARPCPRICKVLTLTRLWGQPIRPWGYVLPSYGGEFFANIIKICTLTRRITSLAKLVKKLTGFQHRCYTYTVFSCLLVRPISHGSQSLKWWTEILNASHQKQNVFCFFFSGFYVMSELNYRYTTSGWQVCSCEHPLLWKF